MREARAKRAKQAAETKRQRQQEAEERRALRLARDAKAKQATWDTAGYASLNAPLRSGAGFVESRRNLLRVEFSQ